MNTIFVSVASFCDPYLRFTIEGLFRTAAAPQSLRVAVIDQSLDDNRSWVRQMPRSGQIQYLQLHPLDSRGCSWARSLAFSCYRGEDFLLQIDSHTAFDLGWDRILIEQLNYLRTLNPKAVLTAHPPPFDFDETGAPRKTIAPSGSVYWLRPLPEQTLEPDDLTLMFQSKYVQQADFVEGHHIAGGLIFSPGNFVDDVPYDPYMYFHGDEQNVALRAFTRGWTIYNPLGSNIPLYHYYRTSGVAHPTQHWQEELERDRVVKHPDFERQARARLCELVGGQRADQPFGLGSVRSLDEFAEQSGIDYRGLTMSEPPPVKLARDAARSPRASTKGDA